MKHALASVLLFVGCGLVEAQSNPQPFLLVRVVFPIEGRSFQEIGTVGSAIQFDYSEVSADRLASVAMHAKLLKKTSQGFQISWTVVQRRDGREVTHFDTREFVPWGTRKRMRSIPGYLVEAFYSSVPANEVKLPRSNRTMQRIATRPATKLSMTAPSTKSTAPLPVAIR